MIYKTLHRTLMNEQHAPLWNPVLLHLWHPSSYSCYKPGDKSWMRKGPECGHLWHRYSSTVYQVMVATVKPSTFAFNFTTRKHLFSIFPVSSELYNGNHDMHRTPSSGISYQLRHVYITSCGIFSLLKFPHVSYIARWRSQPIFNFNNSTCTVNVYYQNC